VQHRDNKNKCLKLEIKASGTVGFKFLGITSVEPL